MSHDQIAHLYRNRHRLGQAELEWAARRAAVIDAHHVAKVHQRYGIVDGFEITASEKLLEVGPGSAYTPCGDLIATSRRCWFPPPAKPGTHTIVLDPAGTVSIIEPESRRAPASLHIGSIRAIIMSAYPSVQISWIPSSLSTGGRLAATAHRRAHVATGVEHVPVADLNVVAGVAVGSRRVSTTSAGFASPPVYFASVQFTSVPSDQLPIGLIMTDICDVEPSAFTIHLRVRLGAALNTSGLVAIASVRHDNPVGVTIRWLGVLPDRPGPHHLDRPCDEPLSVTT